MISVRSEIDLAVFFCSVPLIKYMCDTVSLGTMKKVVRTCEEDSKIPKLTAGTLAKRIAKKPIKLEQERIAMLLNRE